MGEMREERGLGTGGVSEEKGVRYVRGESMSFRIFRKFNEFLITI